MSISSKEARETKYWLRLLKVTNIDVDLLLNDIDELIKILTAIVKTSQRKQAKNYELKTKHYKPKPKTQNPKPKTQNPKLKDLKKLTHINKKNQPKMVNVGDKRITKRVAKAKADMFLGAEIISLFDKDELTTKKGPVFQTAIIAGIQAVKKTSDLIPMCHPLLINGVDIHIEISDKENIEITCQVEIEGKTGVEMEALTGASVAALTVYDMCKAISQKMVIKEIKLLKKTGGKSDI